MWKKDLMFYIDSIMGRTTLSCLFVNNTDIVTWFLSRVYYIGNSSAIDLLLAELLHCRIK